MLLGLKRLAIVWAGSMWLGGVAAADAPSSEVAVRATVVPSPTLAALAPAPVAIPTASPAPLIITGVGAGAFGAGVAFLTMGIWDKKNQCLGDESCERQSQERILLGGILMGVGVGGIATGVVIGGGGEQSLTVGLRHRW